MGSDVHHKDELFGDKHIPLGIMLKRLMIYLKPEWLKFFFAFLLIIVTVFYLPLYTIASLTKRYM